MYFLTLSEAEGEYAEANSLGFTYFFGTGNDGGSCGYDIINDEKMPASDTVAIDELEDILHILITLPTAFAGLATTKSISLYDLIIYR